MSDIFLRSDPKLDAAISNCNDPEEIRQLAKSHLASQGVIGRERGNDYGLRIIAGQPQQQSDGVALPASGYKFEREVKFAPSTGKRMLVIRANTLEDLDALERQVTGQ